MDNNTLSFESSSIEEHDLDSILNGIPAATVNANSLEHARQEPEKEIVDIDFSLPKEESLDDILGAAENEEVLEEQNEEVEQKPEESPAPIVEEKKTKKSKEESNELDESALKQITDFYISTGHWKDFDGREELEYNSETFQDLLIQQNEAIAKEKFDELLESTGPTGKAIIDYVSKGGKPDEIIDLFKEQKQNSEFASDTPEEQKQFIAQYYKDVHGFSNEKIKRIVNAAEADGTLNEEIDEIKTSYEKYYSKEIERVNKEQEDFIENQRKAEEKFQNDITSEITSREDLTPKDKQTLKDLLLNYDQKLPDGTKVNKFYIKFAEMQNDLKKYVDFVQYVTDTEKYLNKIRKKEETKATEKVFLKIKRNASVDKTTGSNHAPASRTSDTEDFTWR